MVVLEECEGKISVVMMLSRDLFKVIDVVSIRKVVICDEGNK